MFLLCSYYLVFLRGDFFTNQTATQVREGSFSLYVLDIPQHRADLGLVSRLFFIRQGGINVISLGRIGFFFSSRGYQNRCNGK